MAVNAQLVTKIKRSCPSIIFYKVNDKLNKINEISMLNVTYGEALAALKLSGNSVRLTVQRKSVPGRSNAHVLKYKNSDGRHRSHSSERSRAFPSAHWKKSDGNRKTSSVSDAKIVNVPVVHMSVKAGDSEKKTSNIGDSRVSDSFVQPKSERVNLEKRFNESYGIKLGTRLIIQERGSWRCTVHRVPTKNIRTQDRITTPSSNLVNLALKRPI